MPIEFKLPDPGEGIHEAEVLKVLVSEGDRVEEEQPIVEIETDKAAIEIPSPVTGTIKEVRVKEGDVIQVGDVIMVFLQEGERQKGEAAEEPKKARKEAVEAQRVPQEESRALKREQEARAEEKEEPEEKEQKKEEPERPREAKGPVPAAPATRRLARELGVDLKDVKPSGPGGRVTAEDIRAHAEKPKEKPQEKPKPEEKPARAPRLKEAPQLPDFTRWGPVERTPFRSIRRATAKRMALSWEQIPHVVHQDLADI
ncbi:MAG: biotin/lipoyl-binding protein, partial [Desulfobacteraceae bacterium]